MGRHIGGERLTDMFLMPVSPETEASAIVALNRETEGNGLRLTHAQAEQLVEVRAQSLRRTGRIEFAPGRVERIIRAFCDSPYLSQEDYAHYSRVLRFAISFAGGLCGHAERADRIV